MIIYIILGKYYLNRFSNPGIQTHKLSAVLPHPEFSTQSFKNDIALLKLSKSADYTNYVRPICLWSSTDDFNQVVNERGTVIGFGYDETGRLAETLTQANMPIVSKETCIYSLPDFYARFTNEKSFCAGFRNGKEFIHYLIHSILML